MDQASERSAGQAGELAAMAAAGPGNELTGLAKIFDDWRRLILGIIAITLEGSSRLKKKSMLM